jgi:beta-lactamase superfamily II metal-dependent hydrolase
MKQYIVLIIIVVTLFVTSCVVVIPESIPSSEGITVVPGVPVTIGRGKILEVYFVDVGQGDCTIYWYDKTNALIIDAGSGSYSTEVISFIKTLGIKHFDAVIATHPDEDHIGSLDTVINTFGTDKVYAPKITKDTVAFSNFATAVQNQGIRITPPVSGDNFYLGDIPFKILAPNSAKYSETNNYSLVTKVIDGKYSFLNMGDAAFESENEMRSKEYDLQSNVIKIGHHGSSTSTSRKFFLSVNPDYSVISVGKDNKYGHPSQETLDTISSSKIYRTDQDGTIMFSTDGLSMSPTLNIGAK